jgi:hypothetical protein
MPNGPAVNPFQGTGSSELRRALDEEARQRPADLREQQIAGLTNYVFDPTAVPREHANLTDLLERLGRRFHLTFDDSGFRGLAAARGMSDVELMRETLERNEILEFQNGMLRLDAPPRQTPVLNVAMTRESVTASVVGSTVEASWVAQQTAQELWASTGAGRDWSDLSRAVQHVGYRTTTKVHLGWNLEDFFSTEFRDFKAEHLEAEDSLGTTMGRQPYDRELLEARKGNVISVAYVDGISMTISLFNKKTGRSEQNDLRFNVANKEEARQGIVAVTTELESTRHTELISRLRDYLSRSGGESSVAVGAA